MQALRTSVDPRTLDDPAAAFADATPIPFAKPSKWPGPEAAPTVARLLWDDSKLYIAYFCEGSFAEAVDPTRCTAAALSALQKAYDPSYSDPRMQRVVMLDDRVEVFLCQTVPTVLRRMILLGTCQFVLEFCTILSADQVIIRRSRYLACRFSRTGRSKSTRPAER